MSRTVQLLFIVFFLTVLYGVGAVQAIVELKRGDTVQFWDFFEDTFSTPRKRANELHDISKALNAKVDSVGEELNRGVALAGAEGAESTDPWEQIQAERMLEEALFLLQDFRKRFQTVNRNFQLKDSKPKVMKLDSLRLNMDKVYKMARYGKDIGEATGIFEPLRAEIRSIGAEHSPKAVLDIPKLAWEAFFNYTFFSANYLRSYDSEMEDGSVVAKSTRKGMQFIRYALLHDVGEKAVYGKNGWLFYRPDVDFLVRPWILDKRSQVVDYNDKKAENAISTIVKFRDQLKALDIDLLVMIVPGKPSIYPDLLVQGMTPEMAGTFSHSKIAIKMLQDSGVACVDLFGPFARERKRDPEFGDSLYLRTDTHWRARGLMLAAKLAAEQIRAFSWYDPASETTEYVLDSVIVDRYGDVGTMTQLPNVKVRNLTVNFPVEPTRCFPVYKIMRDESGNEVSRIPYRDDFTRRSQIMVLGDSFSRIYQTDEPRSAGWIAHLARELGQPVASIVNDGGASTLVRQVLARKLAEAQEEGRTTLLAGKKLVVWEFIERDFRFGAEGWQDIELSLKK